MIMLFDSGVLDSFESYLTGRMDVDMELEYRLPAGNDLLWEVLVCLSHILEGCTCVYRRDSATRLHHTNYPIEALGSNSVWSL